MFGLASWHAGVSRPNDPYLGAPGQQLYPGDPYGGNTFAPGILNLGNDIGHGSC